MAGNAEIDLPASPYRLLNALDEIGIKSTKEIVYQEILNYGSFGYLEPHFDEYTMLEELNTLAQKLAVFDRVDSIAFEGLVKMAEQKPEPFGVKELINFAHSTESCHVVSDVFDDEQLGRFYAGNGFMPEYETLPDKIYEHLDFAKIGREARESEGGVFTQRGYPHHEPHFHHDLQDHAGAEDPERHHPLPSPPCGKLLHRRSEDHAGCRH